MTSVEVRKTINNAMLAQLSGTPADGDGDDDDVAAADEGNVEAAVSKRAAPQEVRLTMGPAPPQPTVPLAAARDFHKSSDSLLPNVTRNRRKGSVGFAGHDPLQSLPPPPATAPPAGASRAESSMSLAVGEVTDSYSDGRRSTPSVSMTSLWWNGLMHSGRHVVLAAFCAPALAGVGGTLLIGFNPYNGLGGHRTHELRAPVPLGATLNFFLTAGAYAPLLISCLFIYLLVETSEAAARVGVADQSGAHGRFTSRSRMRRVAGDASLGELGLWIFTLGYYVAWMLVAKYAHAPDNPLLGVFRTTSIILAVILFVVGLMLFTLMVHILRSFVLRDRQAKASKYVLRRVLPRVRITMLLQLFCVVYLWASASATPLLFYPVAFGSGGDDVPPCVNITATYVADNCNLGGGGRWRCADGGWVDYSSMMSACDAATAAPAFYVRGASTIAINYNLIFLLISIEFFASGVLDSDAMRPIAGVTIASLSGSALCLVLLVAFVLLPSPAIVHTGVLSAVILFNIMCCISAALLLTFGASAELALGSSRKRKCDVFLSYRVSTDAALVERIYDKLRARGVSVWWDRESLEKGKPFWDCILDGLRSAHVFVPIVSRGALDGLSALEPSSKLDGVLVEYRAVHELLQTAGGAVGRGAGIAVFPLLVGEVKTLNITTGALELKTMFRFYDALTFPTLPRVHVRSVEAMIDSQGLRHTTETNSPMRDGTRTSWEGATASKDRKGSLFTRVMRRGSNAADGRSPSAITEDFTTVAGSVKRVLAFQGHVFKGMEDEAINDAVKSIVDCVLAEKGRKRKGSVIEKLGSSQLLHAGAATARRSSAPGTWLRLAASRSSQNLLNGGLQQV